MIDFYLTRKLKAILSECPLMFCKVWRIVRKVNGKSARLDIEAIYLHLALSKTFVYA